MNLINSEMPKLSDWFKANKLSLNIQKSNYITFKPRQRRDDVFQFGVWLTLPILVLLQKRIITSAERQVSHSRRSGMSQICFFGGEIGHGKFEGIRLYSAIWRSERLVSSRYLEISSISLLLEEERKIVLACPGFEPTHLCDPWDQMRPYVAGLADCATATQGNLRCEK